MFDLNYNHFLEADVRRLWFNGTDMSAAEFAEIYADPDFQESNKKHSVARLNHEHLAWAPRQKEAIAITAFCCHTQ